MFAYFIKISCEVGRIYSRLPISCRSETVRHLFFRIRLRWPIQHGMWAHGFPRSARMTSPLFHSDKCPLTETVRHLFKSQLSGLMQNVDCATVIVQSEHFSDIQSKQLWARPNTMHICRRLATIRFQHQTFSRTRRSYWPSTYDNSHRGWLDLCRIQRLLIRGPPPATVVRLRNPLCSHKTRAYCRCPCCRRQLWQQWIPRLALNSAKQAGVKQCCYQLSESWNLQQKKMNVAVDTGC